MADRYRQLDEIAQKSGKANPFRQQQSAVDAYTKSLFQGVKVTTQIANSTAAYKAQAAQLSPIFQDVAKRQRELTAAGQYDKLKKELKEATEQAEKLGKAADDATKSADKAARGRDSRGRFIGGGGSGSSGGGATSGGGIGGLLSRVGGGNTLAGLAGTAGIALTAEEAIRKLVTTWADYGKVLSEVSALTGLVGKDLEYLDAQAKKLESTSGIAGTEILEAFKNIGSIAPDLLNNKELLADTTEKVILLAQASGQSLPEAARAALGSLNQFGESADQAGRYVNVLAAGAKVGASEISDTAEALKNAGTAMATAGLSFEQGNALIQSLAGVMIRGSEAGTGLRNVILKLETSTDKNLRPSLVGLDKALENAAEKYKTSTDRVKIFGIENITVANRVLDTRKEITKLTEDITGTAVAAEQASTNMNNLASDLQKAGTEFSGFFRDIGESQDGLLRRLTQGFTGFFKDLRAEYGALKGFFVGLATDIPKVIATRDLTQFGNGGFQNATLALQQARDQRRADAIAEGQQQAIKATVEGRTADLVALYQKQGQSVATARKTAAATVAESAVSESRAIREERELLKKEYTETDKVNREDVKRRLKNSAERLAIAQQSEKIANQQVVNLAKQEAALKKANDLAAGEKPVKTAEEKAAEREAQKAERIRQNIEKLKNKAQADYNNELVKLETEFGKARLEMLIKDSDEYLIAQRDLQQKELEATKQHLIKLGQLATSKATRTNSAGDLEIMPNLDYKLPLDTLNAFTEQAIAINDKLGRDLKVLKLKQEYELLELDKDSDQKQLDLFEKHWEQILATEKDGSEKYLKLTQKRDRDRLLLQSEINKKLIEKQTNIELYNIDQRKQSGNETAADFARRNALDANAVRRKANDLLLSQTDAGNSEEIARIKAVGKALDDERKKIESGPKYSSVFELLGVADGLSDDQLQMLEQSASLIGDAIRTVTQIQIEESQKRIDAIQAEIDAKNEQIKEEQDRANEGYANNLSLRQQELADLKAQKAAEQQEQKKAVAAQQTLDSISIASTNAVTVANLISAAAKEFEKNSAIPFVGVALAIAAIATIYATMATLGAKAKAITSTTKLRDGGEIDINGRSHEQGGHRIEGTDIEVEGGEFVTKRRITQKHRSALEALNADNPAQAAMLLFRGLPTANIALPPDYDASRSQQQAQLDFDRMAKELGDRFDAKIDQLINKPDFAVMGDGTTVTHKGGNITYKGRPK